MNLLKIICKFGVLALILSFSGCSMDYFNGQLKMPNSSHAMPALTDSDLESMTKEQIITALRDRAKASTVQDSSLINFKDSLSFTVQNLTGKDIYVVCFSYLKPRKESSWRWDKSPIQKISHKERKVVMIDHVPGNRDRKNVYGYLGVFDTEEEAKDSYYQVLDDNKKIDLDLLHKLKHKTVTVKVEKYGVKGDRLSFELANSQDFKGVNPELDLFIQNDTGKDVLVTCFVYEQGEGAHEYKVWQYTKLPLVKIKAGQSGLLDVRTIKDPYIWEYMRGVLAVFDASQEELAKEATFELTDHRRKVDLGLLTKTLGKKIVLKVEKYGTSGDFIEYVVKKPYKKPEKFKAWK